MGERFTQKYYLMGVHNRQRFIYSNYHGENHFGFEEAQEIKKSLGTDAFYKQFTFQIEKVGILKIKKRRSIK